MKTPRVIISASVLGALFLAFFIVPLPVTRVRERGVVMYQENEMIPVHIEVAGILKKVHVEEGQHVIKGKVLAEFSNPDLEIRRNKALHELNLKRELVALYTQRLGEARDPKEKTALQNARTQTEGERDSAQRNLDILDKELERLTIRAPRDGHVNGLPQPDEVGKRFDKEQGIPLCSIGDRTKLRVLVPIHSVDFDLVRENITKLGPGEKLRVTIRVQGRDSKTWQGWVNPDLPPAEAKEVPLPLSSKGGGPVAVRPSSDPGKLIPQAQVFLVAVDFDDADEAICTGTMAQIKIHCEYRSCAWWCWRSISQAIDLYLL